MEEDGVRERRQWLLEKTLCNKLPNNSSEVLLSGQVFLLCLLAPGAHDPL